MIMYRCRCRYSNEKWVLTWLPNSMSPILCLVFLLLTASFSPCADGFMTTPSLPRFCCQRDNCPLPSISSRRRFRLLGSSGKDDEEPSKFCDFDLDRARESLESLLKRDANDLSNEVGSTVNSTGTVAGNGNSNSNADNIRNSIDHDDENHKRFTIKGVLDSKQQVSLPPTPPLSAIERDRRKAEIELLKRLEDGDEASAHLWNLWYSERGKKARQILEEADRLMGDPTSWNDCEAALTGLVDDYGIYFVEPVNRLATLYYLQGKFQDSYKLCQIILKIKPWHFGALAGTVQVCIGMGDLNAARAWAERRLPSLASGPNLPPYTEQDDLENPRRSEWVERMVATAKDMFQTAEQNTKDSFGKPEPYYRRTAKKRYGTLPGDDIDGGAWQ